MMPVKSDGSHNSDENPQKMFISQECTTDVHYSTAHCTMRFSLDIASLLDLQGYRIEN